MKLTKVEWTILTLILVGAAGTVYLWMKLCDELPGLYEALQK